MAKEDKVKDIPPEIELIKRHGPSMRTLASAKRERYVLGMDTDERDNRVDDVERTFEEHRYDLR